MFSFKNLNQHSCISFTLKSEILNCTKKTILFYIGGNSYIKSLLIHTKNAVEPNEY